MNSRLSTISALACLVLSGCSSTISGTAAPTAPTPLTTVDALPGLLLSADDVGTAMSNDDMAVTRETKKAWTTTAPLSDPGCLAIAGAAQQVSYADSGVTAVLGQVLREPPSAPVWAHYAVQAVALFPTANAAAEFYTASRTNWARCANQELTYPQPIGPNQIWTVGQVGNEHDVLSVSRIERSPQRWACQRALTVHNNVAVDVEACSLDAPTDAAIAIVRQISSKLPAA